MLASHRFPTYCFLLQNAVLSLALPLLGERSNNYHLKCTNAPTVVAGYYLNPKDAIAPSSASATCEAQYEYLFCIPGTYTYLFFGTIEASLQPATSYAQALISSIEFVNQHIEFSGDGPITEGDEYFITSGTNVQVYVEDANNHQLTWGVAGVALQGLNTWMAVEDNGYSDATFQINDGRNWVGNGYIGALNPQEICVFANAYVPNTTCSATDANGFVYGGKLC